MGEQEKNTPDVARLAQEALYVAVGFGVLVAQKIIEGGNGVKSRLGPRGEAIDKGVGDLVSQLSELKTQVSAQLTPKAKDLLDKAQSGAHTLQEQIRDMRPGSGSTS
jgi:hypothetical protein